MERHADSRECASGQCHAPTSEAIPRCGKRQFRAEPLSRAREDRVNRPLAREQERDGGGDHLAGQRGTLRSLWRGTELDGRFRGKTGTISGVRSISGVLETPDGVRYVSAVSNGAGSPNSTIGEILRQSRVAGLCPAL